MRTGGILLLCAAGCGGFDPFRETEAASPLPSGLFVPEAERAAPALPEPPRLRGRTLTLSECVETALERNPRTRAAWLGARAAAARAGEERSAFLPSAAFVAGVARSDTPDLRDDGFSPEAEHRAGFALRWVLWDGGARGARTRGAEAELLAANFLHNAALLDVAVAVELAYAERLAAKALAGVAEEAARRSEVHVQLARARLQAGTAARYDLLKAETEKADSDLALVRARGAERVARGGLCQAMGVRVSETFEIEDLGDGAGGAPEDVERLLEAASRIRPELRAVRARVEARREDLRAAEAEFHPVVSAGAEFGWTDRREEWGRARDERIVGVGVTLPLFEGFRTTYRAARARADLARAAAEEEALLKGVELEVWTEYSRAVEAVEAIEAARKFKGAADEAARVAEGMYRAGAGSIIEMVDSLAARTAANTRLVQAGLDLHSARARFERAAGRTRGVDR